MKEIPYEKRRRVYDAAIERYGAPAQKWKLVEEVSELQNAVAKHLFGRDTADHVAEEIADVTIMLEQMRLIYDCNEQVKAIMANKVARLAANVLPPNVCEALLE